MRLQGSAKAAVPATGPTPGAPEREEVRRMFDRIAPRYDLLNRVLSLRQDVRWRRACVDSLRLSPGARVLDLCTGTGDLLIEWLSRDPSNRGVGIDIAHEMLVRGMPKIANARPDVGTTLVRGDLVQLPFAPASFDAAMVAFGIRNVGSPPAALSEVGRVLKPGAPLAILELGLPRGWLGRAYRFYFTRLLPQVGARVSGDAGAYTYLPRSVGRWMPPEDLARLMEESGLRDVSRRALALGIVWIHRGRAPGEGGDSDALRRRSLS